MKSKFLILVLSVGACTSVLNSCTTTKGEAGSTTVSVGTQSGERPFWTYDGDWDITKLRSELGDSEKDPKNAYVVTSASVKKREQVPNCYEMAKTRGAAEFASQINKIVKDANVISEDQESSEFNRQLQTKTQAVLVGAETAKKTWATIDEGGDAKVFCWTVVAMPRKNLTKLQKDVLDMLEKEAKGDPELKQRAKAAVDKMASEF